MKIVRSTQVTLKFATKAKRDRLALIHGAGKEAGMGQKIWWALRRKGTKGDYMSIEAYKVLQLYKTKRLMLDIWSRAIEDDDNLVVDVYEPVKIKIEEV